MDKNRLEIEYLEDSLFIDFQNREIEQIRARMKKKKSILRNIYSSISVAASILLIFTFITFRIDSISFINTYIESSAYQYRNVDENNTEHSILIALNYIHEHKYELALKELKPWQGTSDHIDWYIALSYIGLKEYNKAEEYLVKIESDSAHLYHKNYSYMFKLNLKFLKIQKYFIS